MTRSVVAVSVSLIFLSAAISAAQSTGTIAGSVKDTSGAVLPGVTVEASSPALIEKTRTAVTDSAGAYRLENLRPGTYSVTFTLPGFTVVKREGIELTTGFTAALDVELRVGSVEESITVTGASPVVDVQNVGTRTVLTKTVLDNVVMNKSTAGFVAVLLGANNAASRNQQDVAGNIGEFATSIAMNGGRPGDLTHQFDGLRMVSSMLGAGGGVSRTYYTNILMIQEVAIETGNAPASIESGGIQQNYVPKDGGNRFSFTGIANGTGPGLQANNLDDTLRSRGLLTEPGKIRKLYDFGAGVGGPLKQDRLWFYGAGHMWGTQNTVAGTYYNANPGSPIYTPDLNKPGYNAIEPRDGSGRLTWQATLKQKVTFTYGEQENCLCGYAIGATVAPEAGINQTYGRPGPNFFTQGIWNYVATNRLFLRAGVTGSRTQVYNEHSDNVPPSPLAYVEFPRNLSYGTRPLSGSATNEPGTRAGGADAGWWSRTFNFSASYVTGSHSLTAGVNHFSGALHGIAPKKPPDYGLPVVLGLNRPTPGATPVPFQIAEHIGLNQQARMRYNLGTYVQDQWTRGRLTVTGGLRLDMLNAYVPPHCKPADLFTPDICTDGLKNVPNWQDLNPRFGAAYDVFGNGKTAIKAALGRYVVQDSFTVTQASDPLTAISRTTTRPWTDTNGNYYPDCNLSNPAANAECGAIVNPLFGTTVPVTRYAASASEGFATRPYQWQGSLSLQHEVTTGLAATVTYNRTSYGNFFVTDNLNVAPSDYEPYCLSIPVDNRFPGDVSGSQSCGFYDITAAAQARGPNNLILPASDFGKQTDVYNGVTAAISWRFGQGGLLSGGVSLGKTVTDQCFVVDSPEQLNFCHQELPWAAQRQVKFNGTYPLPWWGIHVSGIYQNLPGVPANASLQLTRAQALTQTTLGRPFAGTSVTIPNLFTPNIKLDESLNQVDLRVSKDVRVGRGRIRGTIDIGNVFNSNAILTVNTVYTPTQWLTPAGVLAARIIKFGVEVNF